MRHAMVTKMCRDAWRDRGRVRLGAPVSVLVILTLSPMMAGCQSEAERLQAESLYYLTQVQKILEANVGRTSEAIAGLERFLKEYGDRIREANARGQELLKAMSEAEREEFVRRALEKARPVKERIDTLVRTFPNPHEILRRLRELM